MYIYIYVCMYANIQLQTDEYHLYMHVARRMRARSWSGNECHRGTSVDVSEPRCRV